MEEDYSVSVNGSFDFTFTRADLASLDALKYSNSSYHILHNSRSVTAEITSEDFNRKSYSVLLNSNHYEIKVSDKLDQLIKEMGLSASVSKTINDIKAPMPGMILEVNVSEGQEVKEGDYLLVLEAMKMENTIMAPRDGVVRSVAIEKGQTVDKNQVLIEME